MNFFFISITEIESSFLSIMLSRILQLCTVTIGLCTVYRQSMKYSNKHKVRLYAPLGYGNTVNDVTRTHHLVIINFADGAKKNVDTNFGVGCRKQRQLWAKLLTTPPVGQRQAWGPQVTHTLIVFTFLKGFIYLVCFNL